MFSVGGTVLKEENATAEAQIDLSAGAESAGAGRTEKSENREIFEDDGTLDSNSAQLTRDLMEVAGILAGGSLDDLDEDELSKIDSPLIRAKLQQQIQDKKAAQIAKADLEARRQAWDEQMHSIGGRDYSGAQIHAMHEHLKDEKNAEAFEQELMTREGITKEEARRRRANLQEYLNLQEKKRNGQELTAEEEYQLKNPSPNVANDAERVNNRINNGFERRAYAEDAKRYTAKQEESVVAGRQDFRDTSAAKGAPSLFASSAQSEIKSDVKLTDAYNAKANVIEMDPPPRPTAKREAVATVEPAGNMGFG